MFFILSVRPSTLSFVASSFGSCSCFDVFSTIALLSSSQTVLVRFLGRFVLVADCLAPGVYRAVPWSTSLGRLYVVCPSCYAVEITPVYDSLIARCKVVEIHDDEFNRLL